jgi:hypothetical protein
MDLKTLLGVGRKYGDYTILPLTLKDIAEADKQELATLTLNPVWAFDDKKYKAIFAKWISRKICKDGKPVTLDELIESELPMPWLHEMMTILLDTSGFQSAPKMESNKK